MPRLDGTNIPFGLVLEGMDIVQAIARVPTFKPDARSRQLNVFAQVICGMQSNLRPGVLYWREIKAKYTLF